MSSTYTTKRQLIAAAIRWYKKRQVMAYGAVPDDEPFSDEAEMAFLSDKVRLHLDAARTERRVFDRMRRTSTHAQ